MKIDYKYKCLLSIAFFLLLYKLIAVSLILILENKRIDAVNVKAVITSWKVLMCSIFYNEFEVM